MTCKLVWIRGLKSEDYSHLVNMFSSGTSEGTILVFRVVDKEGSTQVTLAGQLQGHKAAISDMVISEPHSKAGRMLSADEHGTIFVWQDLIPGASPAVTIRDSR